ncbi:flagellar hook-basal body complex protein FliE [Halobacillus litoralis]|uniref:flagellar hook-basal body complex protein FliE n=1 Tax=Halobacillus litoralis TaxID=45668 RepID=UPI001CD3F317|nr:flagellar hook-basal body complex protein FliE [Halobacillus litoralis]MCA0969145.1 flagellar hook-basal body complex protein FliE [Halobacillus litoralis]
MPVITNQIGSPSAPLNQEVQVGKPGSTPAEAHAQFANQLKNAIHNVNESQAQSNEMTQALARGEVENLHDVMITAQKASITMQTTVQVQNKVVEAYKEIMRMQV